MDLSLLDKLVFWHWWVVALVLICIEIFAPSAFFIWCGIAAAVTGIALLVIPVMSWQIQFILFAVLSLVSVILGRMYVSTRGVMDSDQPALNRRGEQYLGRTFTLEEPISNGTGRVRVGDSYWRIQGDDMDKGSRIKVIAVNGSTLVVEAVNK